MIGERILLRAYFLTTDQTHLAPSYQWLVQRASKRKLAGATAIRGILGFGSRGICEPSDWRLVSKAPVIVEIVDTADRIADFIAGEIQPTLHRGMITLERAGVLMYRHRASTDPQSPLELLTRIKDLSTIPQLNGSPHMKTNEDGVLLRVFA